MDEDVWDVKYKRLSKLGEGAHGIVYKAEVLEGKKDSSSPHSGRKRKQPSDSSSAPSEEEIDNEEEKGEGRKIVAIKKIRLRNSKEGLSMEAIREIKLL